MPASKTLVLVDFDGTLMKGDMFAAFLKFRLRDARVLLRLPFALPFFLLFKLKLMDNENAKEAIFKRLFAGESRRDFQQRCDDFWRARGFDLNPSIQTELAKYRPSESEFWIVSANFEPLIASFCEQTAKYSFLATQLEEVGSVLSGKFRGPNCYGAEKVVRLQQQFPNPESYAKIVAYGDSYGDIAMLNWAHEGYLLEAGSWRKIK